MELIDIELRKKEATRRYIVHIVSLLLCSILVITGATLLLVLSNIDYLLMMIIDIILVSAYILLLIFYFINVFPIVRHYYTFFRGMNKTSLDRARYLTFVKEKDRKNINNVSHRTLEFSFVEGNKTYTENLYILDNDEVTIDSNVPLKVVTYHNVIVKYEAVDYAAS